MRAKAAMSLEHSPGRATGTAAFLIKSFCVAHSISQAFYFELKSLGLGPREMRLGSGALISEEAACDWRRSAKLHPSPEQDKAAQSWGLSAISVRQLAGANGDTP